MKIQDITRIENSLGLRLPENYREWALLLPSPDQETDWQFAFNDPTRVIEANENLRSEGCQGQDWPPELFCIGEADGNHYFISLKTPDHVYYTNHDDGPYFSTDSWRVCEYEGAIDFYKSF